MCWPALQAWTSLAETMADVELSMWVVPLFPCAHCIYPYAQLKCIGHGPRLTSMLCIHQTEHMAVFNIHLFSGMTCSTQMTSTTMGRRPCTMKRMQGMHRQASRASSPMATAREHQGNRVAASQVLARCCRRRCVHTLHLRDGWEML